MAFPQKEFLLEQPCACRVSISFSFENVTKYVHLGKKKTPSALNGHFGGSQEGWKEGVATRG